MIEHEPELVLPLARACECPADMMLGNTRAPNARARARAAKHMKHAHTKH